MLKKSHNILWVGACGNEEVKQRCHIDTITLFLSLFDETDRVIKEMKSHSPSNNAIHLVFVHASNL